MGCLSASLGVYSTNFAKILRCTWIWVLALSVVLGLATFVSPLAVLGSNSMGQFAGTIAAGCLVAVASVVLDSVVKSNVVVMLNDEKRGVAFRKMLKVDVFSIVLFAVCLMVFAGSTYLLMSIESVRGLARLHLHGNVAGRLSVPVYAARAIGVAIHLFGIKVHI